MRSAPGITAAALLVCLLAADSVAAAQGRKGSYSEAPTPPASAQEVRIGFYPVSVYQLDLANNTYYVDTYVWLRWKGDIDPTATIEFTNMVEEWGKQQEGLREEVKTLPDGSKYQILRIEGRFVQPFSLAKFPLDRQHLRMQVEDTIHGVETLSYVIDTESSGLGAALQIPGWKLDGWSGRTLLHDYGSKFGEEATPSSYSVAEFSIDISRPASFFTWKLLMPLFIVVMAAFSALLIQPQALDARSALPVGALLSAIFLQKSYSDNLPDLGYLVLMDKIYLVAYLLIVLTLIRVIFAYLRTEDADAATVTAVHAVDRRLLVLCASVFVVAVALIVALH